MVLIGFLVFWAVLTAVLFFVQKRCSRPGDRYHAKKRRRAAAVLSFFGFTGAGRFYLGYLGFGALQLLGTPGFLLGLYLLSPDRAAGLSAAVGLDASALRLVGFSVFAAAELWGVTDGARVLKGSLGPRNGSSWADGADRPVKRESRVQITFNAPVTLSFFFVCLFTLLLNVLTGGKSNRLLFSVYNFSFSDPLSWLRLFTHVLGHQNFSHFIGNMMYLLLLGPLLEEKYGPGALLLTVGVTAAVTGILACLQDVCMLGASGVVFAFILMSSFTAVRRHELPLTVILVAALYLGQQVYEMVAVGGNVAYFAHIAGGLVGAGMGCVLARNESAGSR